MKVHPTVIEKLIKIYTNYGGYREEHRLRDELKKLDLTPYTRQAEGGGTFLVLTQDIEDYLKTQK
jgi:hypothetical protein